MMPHPGSPIKLTRPQISSCTQYANAASFLDLLLGLLREVACLYNDGLLRHLPLAHHFHVSFFHDIDHRGLVSFLLEMSTHLLWDKRPEALNVDDWANLSVLDQVEVTHSDLSEIARMVFVEVNAVVMLTSRISTATWVFAVFTDASTPCRNLSTMVTILLEAGSHRSRVAGPHSIKILIQDGNLSQ